VVAFVQDTAQGLFDGLEALRASWPSPLETLVKQLDGGAAPARPKVTRARRSN
jgi:hypothetical protein